MANSITIPLDPQTARAYDSAAPEDKRKMQALLGLWLRELANADHPSLEQILDEVGTKAKGRGLTPEILTSLLKAD
ncbi:MAG: hypothetical protein ACLPPV_13695 [Candidatus Korobacteraceae bacterium]|jgi:hypothetical protein